MTCDKTPTLL